MPGRQSPFDVSGVRLFLDLSGAQSAKQADRSLSRFSQSRRMCASGGVNLGFVA